MPAPDDRRARDGSQGVAVALAVALAGCGGTEPAPRIFSSDCELCHIQSYDRTTDPPHLDRFPPRCVACHLTDAWVPDDNAGHDELFPIARGDHEGFECKECHVPPDGFFGVSCIDCHDHAEEPMAREHRGNGSYRWASDACLRCHPEGGA